MKTNIDKRARATQFRERLALAMGAAEINQSGLARAIQVDRSTISQLLLPNSTRLPNAHVVAECAATLGVSADWLLGLAARPERVIDIMAAAVTMPEAPRAPIDDMIFDWHKEAEGYKIRHVPSGLPDLLKTPDMLRWEYEAHLGRTTEQAIGAATDRLDWMRGSKSDYEIALPLHDLKAFAHGTGYYEGVPRQTRRDQLSRLAHLNTQLYPTLRLFLYDAHRLYSAPITVFGPLLAVMYLGRNYLAFRDNDRISVVSRHFDMLVREAQYSGLDVSTYIMELRGTIA